MILILKKRSSYLDLQLARPPNNTLIQYFIEKPIPYSGVLVYCRDYGFDYDFRIESNIIETYNQVKGIADISGGFCLNIKNGK